MSELGPVIATTDGSVRSHRVLPHAGLAARLLGSRLVLLRVFDARADARLELGEGAGETGLQRARERISAEMEWTLTRLGLGGVPQVEERRGHEKTADALRRAIVERGACLAAMDSRGHGALRHVLHGSVALDLLASGTVPVLATGPNVEGAAEHDGPYRVVLTSDGSAASRAAPEALASMLERAPVRLTLLRVHEHAPRGEDDRSQVENCYRQLQEVRSLLPPSVDVEVVVREVPRGAGVDTSIIEKAMQVDADAIALSSHGHSARRHMLMGSVATTLLGRSSLPLILVRSRLDR